MRSIERAKSRTFGPFVAILIVAFASADFDVADAQPYYYQPASDYYHNDTASGTFMGGALGAVTGAIIGGRKDRGEGALIGAGIGAVTGNLMGRSKDRADQQQAAAGAAVVGNMNQQAAATAITNYDLLEMTRAGVSEDVIISTMRARGVRLDLSPQSLISLKQSGVSDRVVLAAQDMNRGGPYMAGPPPVALVEPVPTRVIVAPAPWPYYGPRYRYYHYHHRPRTHIHYSVGF
ncbi:MAG: glycine zipper domain-containing protein [Pirellulales bacterium]